MQIYCKMFLPDKIWRFTHHPIKTAAIIGRVSKNRFDFISSFCGKKVTWTDRLSLLPWITYRVISTGSIYKDAEKSLQQQMTITHSCTPGTAMGCVSFSKGLHSAVDCLDNHWPWRQHSLPVQNNRHSGRNIFLRQNNLWAITINHCRRKEDCLTHREDPQPLPKEM